MKRILMLAFISLLVFSAMSTPSTSARVFGPAGGGSISDSVARAADDDDNGDNDNGDDNGLDDDGATRGRAASYINPDIGAPTFNATVDDQSSCFEPDQSDGQPLSAPGTTANNVHNDACFLDDDDDKVDGPASFQSSGVGEISACPDPDGAGPKVAILSDTNGDGRMDLCFQSGYQETGAPGDFEFHARLNNSTTPGTQTVVFCSDVNMNGCGDEGNTEPISIQWGDDADLDDDDFNGDGDGDDNGDGNGDDNGDDNGLDDDGATRGRAASYINPDIGAPTFNATVDDQSSCFEPDQSDGQPLSAPGTTANNVHNDACFLDDDDDKVDGPASFQSSGVGEISACPDPDGAGPKVAVLSDTNGDGRMDLCFQSGFQETGAPGDFEFHARLNNTTTPGTQTVVFCSDVNMNGCDDEGNTEPIRIQWGDDADLDDADFRNDDD